MANHASAEKRNRQRIRRTERNRAVRSAVLSSSPVNKLPFDFQGTYLGVHLIFK